MKHFGDITKIKGADVPPVDIICGGSPCQDLSVAGERRGLRHSELGDEETTRSGLFMEQIRIIKEMRDADRRNGRPDDLLRPRFMVFENVEGLFSSNDGEDFRIVLEETARIADSSASIPRLPTGQTWSHAGAVMGCGWSLAWRLHDGQFWGKSIISPDGKVVKRGTPQRRRRLCLIADFGGQSAPEILFESESLSGHIEPSGETWQGTAEDPSRCADGTSYTLKIRGGVETDSHGRGAGKGALVQKELSGTLGVTQDQTLVKVYGMSPFESNAMKSSNPESGIYEAETSRTLDLNGGNPACNQGGMMVVEPVCYRGDSITSTINKSEPQRGDPCHTLSTDGRNYLVQDEPKAYGLDRASFNQGKNAKFGIGIEAELAQPIVSRGAGGGNDHIIGALQARDFKGVGSQYVAEGKVIVQQHGDIDE